MRLPAITPRQIIGEHVRQRHEDWYQAFLDGTRITYPTTPAESEKFRWTLATNPRPFWRERGFKICTRVRKDHRAVTVWLERLQQTSEAA
jgi:hypothetical protein